MTDYLIAAYSITEACWVVIALRPLGNSRFTSTQFPTRQAAEDWITSMGASAT